MDVNQVLAGTLSAGMFSLLTYILCRVMDTAADLMIQMLRFVLPLSSNSHRPLRPTS